MKRVPGVRQPAFKSFEQMFLFVDHHRVGTITSFRVIVGTTECIWKCSVNCRVLSDFNLWGFVVSFKGLSKHFWN